MALDKPKDVTILIVEDEAAIRLMIADALREAGFGVVEAGTGDEALSLLESGIPVNLVFTDVMMPGKLDGLSLVSRLRVTRPEVKVVVGSALSPQWPAPNFVDLFIGKPYDVPRAIERLKALLRNEPGLDASKDAEGARKADAGR